MRDGIDWAEVGSGERFEKIVSTLLSTLFPDSERIDGSGGDGGRDHQLRTGEQLDVWQSKHFLTRLSESSTRKKQITKSLARAASLLPNSWILVTPMVPNLHERAWFDGLKCEYPFPIVWRGGDWLEARLAEHPSIVRHFMGAEDQYVALLRELQQEQEALVNGLPAALPRIEALAEKIDDSNPFYKVDFVVKDGKVVNCHLRPKYRGAEKDSPVTIRFDVVAGRADGEPVESLRFALDWGEEVALPASHVRNVVVTGPPGFGGVCDQAEAIIGPGAQKSVDLNLRLVICAQNGRHLAALPAQLFTRVAGVRGVTLHGMDLTGLVNARLRVDPLESRFILNLTSTWWKPLLPGALLPVLRFMQHASPPNTLSFRVGDTMITAPVEVPTAMMAVSADVIRLIEDLNRLQTAAGEPFPVPEELTMSDQLEIRRAARLLEGQRVKLGSGHVCCDTNDPRPFIEAFENSQISSLKIASPDPYVAHVAGHELGLGSCTFYIPRAQLDQSSIAPTGDGTYKLAVFPGPGFRMSN